MSDNVEYQFHSIKKDDVHHFMVVRLTYEDAGPDAVGPLLSTEYSVGGKWTETIGVTRVIGPDEDYQQVTQRIMAKVMKAHDRGNGEAV